MHFGCLRQDEIDTYWSTCRALLIPAFRDAVNIYTVDDYYTAIKDGGLHLWVAVDGEGTVRGTVVTSIDQGSAMSICTVHSIGGKDLNSWVSLFDEAVTKFARDNGCKAIEAVTRKGFTKVFPDLIEDGTIYVRILKDE